MSVSYPLGYSRFATVSGVAEILPLAAPATPVAVGADHYASLDANDAFSEFDNYDVPGWDGYDAQPILPETVRTARAFQRLFPMELRAPDVAPGADGTIGFEWRTGAPAKRLIVLFEVGPGDRVAARQMFPDGTVRRYPVTRVGTGARALISQLLLS